MEALSWQTIPVSSTTVVVSWLQGTARCLIPVTAVWLVILLEVQKLLEVEFAASSRSQVIVTGGSVIGSNRAGGGGGGVAARQNASVVIAVSSVVANNTAVNSGGIDVGGFVQLLVTGRSVIEGNDPSTGMNGGLTAGSNSTVNITHGVRFRNNKPGGVQFQSQLASVGSSIDHFLNWREILLYIVPDAKVHLDDSIVGDDGPLTLCSSTVYMMPFGSCPPGMFRDFMFCKCCQASTYSFEGNITMQDCRSCPSFATCPGADQVVPDAGYWHSSPKSVQIHQCPLQVSACGAGGECNLGYEGKLCAKCSTNYGMTLPFRCRQCMPPGRQLGLYLLLSCLTVVFITLIVYFTWRDSRQGGTHLRQSDFYQSLHVVSAVHGYSQHHFGTLARHAGEAIRIMLNHIRGCLWAGVVAGLLACTLRACGLASAGHTKAAGELHSTSGIGMWRLITVPCGHERCSFLQKGATTVYAARAHGSCGARFQTCQCFYHCCLLCISHHGQGCAQLLCLRAH